MAGWSCMERARRILSFRRRSTRLRSGLSLWRARNCGSTRRPPRRVLSMRCWAPSLLCRMPRRWPGRARTCCLGINLLPAEMRSANSRALWIPTGVAAGLVLMAAVALAAYPAFEDRRYLHSLNAEIAKIKPRAAAAAKLDKDIETARQRTHSAGPDAEALQAGHRCDRRSDESLPPPIWLNTLEITRAQVTVAGETDQAAPLLKQIDASPFFEASEFSMQPMRTQSGEALPHPGEPGGGEIMSPKFPPVCRMVAGEPGSDRDLHFLAAAIERARGGGRRRVRRFGLTG